MFSPSPKLLILYNIMFFICFVAFIFSNIIFRAASMDSDNNRKEQGPSHPQESQKITTKKKWIPPPGYATRRVRIERERNTISKQYPTLSPKSIDELATKKYKTHIEYQTERTKFKRQKFKELKQAVQTVDKELGSLMRINASNSKQAWIARRVKKLQDENKELTLEDAQSHAKTHYLEKLERDNASRRQKRAKRRSEQ